MLYFNSFVLPLFDYGDMIWGDKTKQRRINARVQVLQNKAAKIILGWPVHSSATGALRTLNWFNLSKGRLYHRYLYVFKCINGLLKSHLSLITLHDVHQMLEMLGTSACPCSQNKYGENSDCLFMPSRTGTLHPWTQEAVEPSLILGQISLAITEPCDAY